MPATPSTQAPPYRVGVPLRDLITQTPVANAQVKLCRKIDVECAMPVSTAVSDATGAVTFSVDMTAFSGYVLIESDGYVPTLYFFNPPIDRDLTIAPVSMASPLANMGLLFQLGHQQAPGHGNVVISSEDCTGAPAAGVSYATPSGDGMTAPFYTVAGLPTPTATTTDAMGGYGGLVNVPVGPATVTATLVNPQTDLGTISMLVRDGAITYSRIVPLGK